MTFFPINSYLHNNKNNKLASVITMFDQSRTLAENWGHCTQVNVYKVCTRVPTVWKRYKF